MTILQRNLSPLLNKYLRYFPVVAIIGARQVGKTQLAKSLGSQWEYFDLENPLDFDRISRDPVFFFKEYSHQVILDEAQECPEIFRTLRGVVDEKRQLKGRFLITGSSSPELLSQISESLAGRIGILELGTLKANEFYQKPLPEFYQIFTQEKLKPKNLAKLSPQLTSQQLKSFWLKGGYPEPRLSKQKGFYKPWMENYRSTYLNRDLRKLFPKLNITKYRRFLNMLARLSGTVVKKSDLARSLDISEPTVKEYIDIAHGTFLWRNLPSFEHQIEKSTVKMPRGHIRDSGLCHYLLKIETIEDLENDPILGRSFENFVIEEIIKGVQATGLSNWTYHYYRTKNGLEIDCVIEGPKTTIPIESKYGLSVPQKKLKTLETFINKHKLDFGILVNNAPQVEWISSNVLQVPATCL